MARTRLFSPSTPKKGKSGGLVERRQESTVSAQFGPKVWQNPIPPHVRLARVSPREVLRGAAPPELLLAPVSALCADCLLCTRTMRVLHAPCKVSIYTRYHPKASGDHPSSGEHFGTPAKVVCGGPLHRVKSPETSERCRTVQQHPQKPGVHSRGVSECLFFPDLLRKAPRACSALDKLFFPSCDCMCCMLC